MMETRNQSRRAATLQVSASEPVDEKRSTRQTRQTTALVATNATESASFAKLASVAEELHNVTSTSFTQIPRRGARAASDISIPSEPPRADDESEIGEEAWDQQLQDGSMQQISEDQDEEPGEGRDDDDDGNGNGNGNGNDNDNDNGDDDDDDDVSAEAEMPMDEADKRHVLLHALPHLERVTKDLFQQIQSTDYGDKVSRHILGRYRSLFELVRMEYEKDTTEPFVEVSQLDDDGGDRDGLMNSQPRRVLTAANLVTALDEVARQEGWGGARLQPFLESLYEHFPDMFLPSLNIFNDPTLTLDLRTQYLLGRLDNNSLSMSEARAIIAQVFCGEELEQSQVKDRLVEGPFLSLGGHGNDYDLYTERLAAIYPLLRELKPEGAVKVLRERFSLKKFFTRLREWLLETYEAVMSWQDNVHSPSPEPPKCGSDHEEGDEESAESRQSDHHSQSPPIVRAPERHTGISLFRGPESLQWLNRGRDALPPSNRHQDLPDPSAPRDYQNHTNHELLNGRPSPVAPNEASSRHARVALPVRAHKRKEEERVPSESDEDDRYQTDTRPIPNSKRVVSPNYDASNKRPRLASTSSGRRFTSRQSVAIKSPPSSKPTSLALSQKPPPPAASSSYSSSYHNMPPPSSLPNFSAVKERKRLITQTARCNNPPMSSPRQRIPWSDKDTDTLQRLIAERQARWADIERYDSHRFETHRLQQAFRDKARNMKVDYLLTDTILPPCFDLVALGKKEVDRLRIHNKNPWRKEADIDPVTNEPTNVRYYGE